MDYVRVHDHLGQVSHYVVLDDDHWRVGSIHSRPADPSAGRERRTWWAEDNQHQPITNEAGQVRYFASRAGAAGALLSRSPA